MRHILLILLCLIVVFPTFAQDTQYSVETINISASDDLSLVGDLYLPDEVSEPAPAVLLLHMLNSQRAAYALLIPYLLDQGYVVLNVDMRGHGETGGTRNWDLAIEDVQLWLNFLREQESVNASQVAIIGASIGSNVALIACANDADCVTAVALSPGEDYASVKPADAIENELNAFLIASHNDRYSASSVRTFFSEATGYVSSRMYLGSAHGTNLFINDLESVANAITAWLDEQFAAVEAM